MQAFTTGIHKRSHDRNGLAVSHQRLRITCSPVPEALDCCAAYDDLDLATL